MAVQRLSKLADWRLVDESQDLRGRPLYDRDGNRVGTIDDMLVDTDEEIVRWVRLDDGRRVAAEALNIEEGGVFLDRPIATDKSAERPPHKPAEPIQMPPPSERTPPNEYPPRPGEPAP